MGILSKQTEEKPPITPEDYRRWVSRRCDSGRWFPVFSDYLELMSIEAAWVLQQICNLGNMHPETKLEEELRKEKWILFSAKKAQKLTKLNDDAQERIIRELEGLPIKARRKKDEKESDFLKRQKKANTPNPKRAFIEVKCFGNPQQRYVKIDFLCLDRALDEVNGITSPVITGDVQPSIPGNSREMIPGNSRELYIDGIKEGIEEGRRDAEAPPPVPTPPTINQFTNEKPSKTRKGNSSSPEDRQAVQMLYEARKSKGKQFLDNGCGAEHFRLLREQDGVNYLPVLEWYCARLKEDRIEELELPNVSSSKQFRDRYSWIEEKKDKECNRKQKQDSKYHSRLQAYHAVERNMI